MLNRIIRLLRNPRVQQMLLWVVPIVLGWLFDKSNKTKTQSAAKSKRKK